MNDVNNILLHKWFNFGLGFILSLEFKFRLEWKIDLIWAKMHDSFPIGFKISVYIILCNSIASTYLLTTLYNF